MLRTVGKIPGGKALVKLFYKRDPKGLSREVFGIRFPHPVGLAAGLDKNGEYYNELGWCGFSFIEIGSLTPEPQEGNPRPRVFRLPHDKAIINRMGINNNGVRYAIKNITAHRPDVILGASIAKNSKSRTDEEIRKDYETAFSLMYDFVDFISINVSCPNVEGLQDLQDVSYLSDIIDPLLQLRLCYDTYKPLLIKVSPDLPKEELDDVIHYCLLSGVDGIISGNTTKKRDGLKTSKNVIKKIGSGGLSGAPLYEKNLEMVRYIHEKSQGRLPIIAVGGIMTPEQAKEMLDAGASLIEIYTSFIYEGPSIVKRILKYLENHK
jgi:dihydroorotate dehydrogenase